MKVFIIKYPTRHYNEGMTIVKANSMEEALEKFIANIPNLSEHQPMMSGKLFHAIEDMDNDIKEVFDGVYPL